MSRVNQSMEHLRTSNIVIQYTANFLADRFRRFQSEGNSDFDTLLRIRNQRRIQLPFVNYLALAENLEGEFHFGFTPRNLGPMLGHLLQASLHDFQTAETQFIGISIPITALVVLCKQLVPSEQYFRNFAEYSNDLSSFDKHVIHARHLSQLNEFENWDAYLEAIAILFPN